MVSVSWGRLRCVVFVLLVASLGSPVLGQNVTATLTGTVMDSSGGAVVNASVAARNQKTGVEYGTRTNDVGVYTIPALPIGVYIVHAEAQGFKVTNTSSLTLETGQTARVDIKLEIGAVTESVDVVTIAPILQTDSAVVGQVITGSTATALPLNGRNFAQLTLLVPGAQHTDQMSFTTPGALNGGRPYVNGNREQGNNFMIDGLDANEQQDNLIGYNPSPDALAEIRVETNNYSAEFGNVAGAVVNTIIKSGTNAFHGNGFEFLRNDKFDSNTYENKQSGAPKAQLKQNIFGGTVGGPVVKNKLFFFGDYQGTRIDQPGGATGSVAPASWRNGDFSNLLSSGVILKDPVTGAVFPGNIIPTARFSPVARALLADTNAYPLPTNGALTANYAGEQQFQTHVNQGDVKVDANLSAADSMFARFSVARTDASTGRALYPLAMGTSTQRPSYSFAGNWRRLLSSVALNELRIGFNQTRNDQVFTDPAGLGNYNQTLGIPGQQAIPGMSQINISAAGLDSIGALAANSQSRNNVFQVSDKISRSSGRHFLSAGGQWLHSSMSRQYASNSGMLGGFVFGGRFTGNAFSDFLLGAVSAKAIGGSAPWEQLQSRLGLFAEDDVRMNSKLTLNLGVRWEYFSPLVEKDDHQLNYDLTTGKALFAGAVRSDVCATFRPGCATGSNRGLYDPYYKGFAPRLGFAYTLNDRSVIRGGYGIVQYMEGAGANNRLPQNSPFTPVDSGRTYTATPGSITNGFQDVTSGAVDALGVGQLKVYDPNLRPQITQQWNVFVERELTNHMSLNVGYVGMHGSHMLEFKDSNQPLPGTGNASTWVDAELRRPLRSILPDAAAVRTTGSDARANYNGLQAVVRQRYAEGLEFMASYTLSKAMQDNPGFYGAGWGGSSNFIGHSGSGTGYTQSRNPEVDYGPSFFDVRHNLVLSGNYEIPYGKGRRNGASASALKDTVLGGWNVSTIVTMHTGFPVTVIDLSGRSLQPSFAFERPNRIGDGSVANGSWDKWLDSSAFSTAALGTFGNSEVGILRAPGYWNVDMGIDKHFNIGQSRYAVFRLEAFNIFDHASKGMPNNNFGDLPNFGKITTSASGPRILEFALKFQF